MISILRILFFAFCGGALVFALHRMFDVEKIVDKKKEVQEEIQSTIDDKL